VGEGTGTGGGTGHATTSRKAEQKTLLKRFATLKVLHDRSANPRNNKFNAFLFKDEAHEVLQYARYPIRDEEMALLTPIIGSTVTSVGLITLKSCLMRIMAGCRNNRDIEQNVLTALDGVKWHPGLFSEALKQLAAISSHGDIAMDSTALEWAALADDIDRMCKSRAITAVKKRKGASVAQKTERWTISYHLRRRDGVVHYLSEELFCPKGYHKRLKEFWDGAEADSDRKSARDPIYKAIIVKGRPYVELKCADTDMGGVFLPQELSDLFEGAELLCSKKFPVVLVAPDGTVYRRTKE